MQLFYRSVFTIVILALALGRASPSPQKPDLCETTLAPLQLPLPSRTVFQLAEKPTWFENLAVGPSGDLFVTLLWPTASLYRIRDPGSSGQQAGIVYTIAGSQGLSGIAAVTADTYVVAAANYSSVGVVVPGTGEIWSITVPAEGSGAATARKITDVPESGLLNGLTTVPSSRNEQCDREYDTTILLVADSLAGYVLRVDVATGQYDVAVQVPQMAAPSGAAVPFGVNGIKIRDGYLYWTNTATVSIYRITIDANGRAVPHALAETVAVVTAEASFLDDFTFDDAGDIWVSTNVNNTILRVRPDGSARIVVGGEGDLTVAGATAAQFGRDKDDRSTLYVTTSGANIAPVNGTITEPAKVEAVKTENYI